MEQICLHLSCILCTSHFLRPPSQTPSVTLIKFASEIGVEQPTELVKHTSPTNFGCVINHVEIKVKGEGFDLVLGELTHVRGTRLFLHYFQLSCETDRDP